MMPAQNSITLHPECSIGLDKNEILNSISDKKDILHLINTIGRHRELKDVLNDESFHIQKNIDPCSIFSASAISNEDCANLVNDCANTKLVDFTSQNQLETISVSKGTCITSGHYLTHAKKNLSELSTFSIKKLNIYLEDLSRIIEEVSSKLVELLQENDSLQQESDGRLVVIEQLLKMTVKNPENEVGPIMMSVISLPEDKPYESCVEEIV